MAKWQEIRAEFYKDLQPLLEAYARFHDDPDYEDGQGDSYDFVLDEMQNLYAKWIHKKYL